MNIKLTCLSLLLASCSQIDYSHRVYPVATDVEWRYVENPVVECRKFPGVSLFDVACTVWPDVTDLNDTDLSHWRRAIVIVPLSERDNPTSISEHEKGHLDGYGHK